MNRRSTLTVAAGYAPADACAVDEAAVADIADVFGLLADPGRLRLLISLYAGEASVGQLAEQCGLSGSATSHALRLLRAHQVVEVRRDGRMAFYRLADAHVRELIASALDHQEHAVLRHPERAQAVSGLHPHPGED